MNYKRAISKSTLTFLLLCAYFFFLQETNLLSTKMTGKERIDDSEYCLPNKSFQMFLAVAK